MLPSCHGPRSLIGCGGAPGLDMSHRATMTPARATAAQRHSPGIGKKVRSGGGIFFSGKKKGA